MKLNVQFIIKKIFVDINDIKENTEMILILHIRGLKFLKSYYYCDCYVSQIKLFQENEPKYSIINDYAILDDDIEEYSDIFNQEIIESTNELIKQKEEKEKKIKRRRRKKTKKEEERKLKEEEERKLKEEEERKLKEEEERKLKEEEEKKKMIQAEIEKKRLEMEELMNKLNN